MTDLETLELTADDLDLEITDLEDITSTLSNADGWRIAIGVALIALALAC